MQPLLPLADEGFIDEDSTLLTTGSSKSNKITMEVEELLLGMRSIHDTEGEFQVS